MFIEPVTSSLVLLGLRYGLRDLDDGACLSSSTAATPVPAIPRIATRLSQCEEIRGDDRFSQHCIPPIVGAPGLFSEVVAHDVRDAIPQMSEGPTRACTPIWRKTISTVPGRSSASARGTQQRQDLMDASSAFMGGTAFMGSPAARCRRRHGTGLGRGEVENSVPRVVAACLRMMSSAAMPSGAM